jgi:hypothetical protein
MSRQIRVEGIDSGKCKVHINGIEVFGQLELSDSRFINCCLVGEDQGIIFDKEKFYPVDIDLYAKLCGLYYGEAFDQLLETVDKLYQIDLKVTLPSSAVMHTRLVYKYIHDKASKQLLIRWNSTFIPLISGHMEAGRFMEIAVAMVAIPSQTRYQLYLLIQKNLWKLQKAELFVLTKKEVRDVMGLEDGQYAKFANLNARLIKPTLKDVYNKLGIRLKVKVSGDKLLFSYEEVV